MLERKKVDGNDVELTDEEARCLDRGSADFDLSAVACVALVLGLVSVFSFPDAVGLKGLAFDLELSAFVRDCQISLLRSVVVILLVHVGEAVCGEVHFPQFVLCNVAEHQSPHAWVQVNDLGQFLLSKLPTPQNAFTLFW